jgi:hypothetical protein
MKKLFLTGAALSAALLTGQANALSLNFNDGLGPVAYSTVLGAATVLRAAGASAPTPLLVKAFLNDCANKSGFQFGTTGSGSITLICKNAFAGVGSTYLVLEKRESGGSITGIQGALDALGLAGGAKPALLNDLGANSIDTNGTCPVLGIGTPLVVTPCTASPAIGTNTLNSANVNFADVDPSKFAVPLNNANALTSAIQANITGLSANAVASQVFGVMANEKLYRAMQNAMVLAGKIPASCTATATIDSSEACMPNLTSEQVATILSNGRMTDWSSIKFVNPNGGGAGIPTTTNLFTATAAADRPANRDIHICNRTVGSGTLASQHVKLINAPCATGAEPVVGQADPVTQVIRQVGQEDFVGTNAGATKVVHQNPGAGDVLNCLDALNDGVDNTTANPQFVFTNKLCNGGVCNTSPAGTVLPAQAFRWAIGYGSLDVNAPSTVTPPNTYTRKSRFIKIDGAAPSAHNVVEGKYKVWSELVQVGSITPAGSLQETLANDLINNMKDPTQIPSIALQYEFGQSSLLGIASSTTFAPTTNATFDAARPVNPYSHGGAASTNGSGIDHCRVPTLPAGTRGMPSFF